MQAIDAQFTLEILKRIEETTGYKLLPEDARFLTDKIIDLWWGEIEIPVFKEHVSRTTGYMLSDSEIKQIVEGEPEDDDDY